MNIGVVLDLFHLAGVSEGCAAKDKVAIPYSYDVPYPIGWFKRF